MNTLSWYLRLAFIFLKQLDGPFLDEYFTHEHIAYVLSWDLVFYLLNDLGFNIDGVIDKILMELVGYNIGIFVFNNEVDE